MTEEELRAVVKIVGGDLVGVYPVPHRINEKLVAMYIVDMDDIRHRFFTTDNDDAARVIVSTLTIGEHK